MPASAEVTTSGTLRGSLLCCEGLTIRLVQKHRGRAGECEQRDGTGSFVPLLVLDIPGSGTKSILLGALIALNVSPGQRLMEEELHLGVAP